MKHYIKLFFALATLLCTHRASMAQAGYQDVVYLKNGGLVRGIIIEQIPNQTIKIQTRDKNVFVYSFEEIEKITREKPNVKTKTSEPDAFKNGKYSGFSFTLEGCIGEGTGSMNDGEGMIGVHPLLGYMHNSKLILGVSMGFTQYQTNREYNSYPSYYSSNDVYIPFDCSIALRLFPVRARVSPLMITDIGYAIVPIGGSDYSTSGGLMLNLGAGARLNFTEKRGINLSFNYRFQKITNTFEYYDSQTQQSIVESKNYNLENICLQVGFTF